MGYKINGNINNNNYGYRHERTKKRNPDGGDDDDTLHTAFFDSRMQDHQAKHNREVGCKGQRAHRVQGEDSKSARDGIYRGSC